ncbi:hypothetical protein AAHE18_19G198700 [Arachis hypogaea]
MPSKKTKNVALKDCTMNFPVKREIAGRKQYTIRNIEVKGYIPTLKYATLCKNFILGLASIALFFEKKISTDPVAQRRTWWSLSVKLIGAVPRKASLLVTQYTDLHPLLCIL